ncbi:MAG: thioesterase family protein [Anaerolineales bacterium]|nr:thioesterase family protein [Anaerolineales bacterium]
METDNAIEVGMKGEQTFVVEERFTAAHLGSGSLRVLATPSMIGFMERTATELLQPRLPPGASSVGVHVDVHHLAATPVGGKVRVTAEVTGVDGRRVDFKVEAWDEVELVGQGVHQRVVIDVERFLQRLERKLPQVEP